LDYLPFKRPSTGLPEGPSRGKRVKRKALMFKVTN
jgi:hypothetical protein